MIVYVNLGKNNLTGSVFVVGVATTLDKAETLARDKEYMIDESKIIEVELTE